MTERRLSIPGPAEYRAAMVLAFLAGRKTQVRLPVKQPAPEFLARGVVGVVPQWPQQDGVRWFMADGLSELVSCPFGVPGDVLWIPETWGVTPLRMRSAPAHEGEEIIYFASDDLLPLNKQFIGHRRPWNHMPRRACRLTRRVVDVRVEQVQAITIDDIEREGIRDGEDGFDSGDMQFWERFRDFWDARYAGTPFAWDKNPMVWVATLEPEGA